MAGSPTAIGRPWSASPPIRAGRSRHHARRRRASRAARSRPWPATTTDSAVSQPEHARPRRPPTRCPCPARRAARGRWRRRRSCRRRAPRAAPATSSAGAQRRVDLVAPGRSRAAAASVSSRWCGVTSAVTRRRAALAQRRISTEPAVDTWQTCSREPTCRASSTSRATIASSATAGQPGQPEPRRDARPRAVCAPVGEPGLLRRAGRSPPSNALTYSSARRMTHAGRARTCRRRRRPAPGPRRRPSRRARPAARPRSPTVTAPTGCTSTSPASRPRRQHLLDDAGGVGDRVGVGHREDRGEAAEGGGGRAGRDGLGVLAAGLAQVGVQVDEAGQQRPGPSASRTSAPGRGRARPDLGDDAVADQEVHAARRRRRAGRRG